MSRDRVALPRGIVALRVLPADGAAPAPAAMSSGCVPMPPLELKELQRRAFDRGQAVERDALGSRLGALMTGLERAIAELGEARARDRAELAAFGVDLAMAVAARVVGDAIQAGRHDVVGLVESVLDEARPGLGSAPVQVFVHPADFDALAEFPAARERACGDRIHVAADPAVTRGGCRIEAGGAEVLADPIARLGAIGERLRSVADGERRDA
jgi:flagellar biosynthesis/type III secretory pathway protein FliH